MAADQASTQSTGDAVALESSLGDIPEGWAPGGMGAWRRALASRPARQSAVYTVATALVMVLGAVGKAILAHALSPTKFGLVAFGVSFFTFAALFFEFGLFVPAARRIAHADRAERAELLGTSLALFVPVGVAFCIAIFGLSFVVQPIFRMNVGEPLRVLSPIAFAYAFNTAALLIAQGADRVATYSLANLLGQALFVVGLFATALFTTMTIEVALAINTAGMLAMLVTFAIAIHPEFRRVIEHGRKILGDARSWGTEVYLGRILSVGTYNMDVLMVAGFSNSKSVGFYVMAGTFAQASGLPVTGLSAALFAPLARLQQIPGRWIVAAWALGAAGIAGVVVLAPLIVKLAFTPAYRPVIALALPLALAQTVRGVTNLYNTYLGAHGRGRQLRNCGFLLTVSNVVLNFALIPTFGARGAAWASFGALLLNYGAHLFYYRQPNTSARSRVASPVPNRSP